MLMLIWKMFKRTCLLWWKFLAPADSDKRDQIPFKTASDGIKQRNIVYQGSSSLTGPIVIEDLVYENDEGDVNRSLPFRRLIFPKN